MAGILLFLAILMMDQPVAYAYAFALDLNNLEQVESAILDNPIALKQWWEEKSAQLNDLPPMQKVRFTRIKYEVFDKPSEIADLDEAIETAKHLHLDEDYADLMTQKVIYLASTTTESTESNSEQSWRNVIATISRLSNPILRARTLVFFSSYLHERGRDEEALATILESYQIIRQNPNASPVRILPVLLHLSTMLQNSAEQMDKSFVISQEIQKICDLYQLRFASLRNLYSTGKYYAKTGPTLDLDKAAEFTQRALVIAEELQFPWEIGTLHTSLINIEHRRNHPHEAQDHARKALSIFESVSDPIWSAEVHLQWVDILLAQKEFGKAQLHLDKASQLFPDTYKKDQARILYLRSEVHKGLGQFEKALSLYERFHKLEGELAKDREQDSYAHSKATLGLQIEEEKNKLLKAENALGEQKLKTARLYIFIGFMAVLFVIGLGFLAMRLHRENRKIIELQEYIHRSVLLRFLPPLIVEEIISGRSRLESEPKEELVTVIFADIVNFTRLTERLGVTHTANILNRFLQTMTAVIFAENGTIDKFIGDAVMVLYGAPSHLDPREQAQKAIQCAVAMHEAVHKLSSELQKEFGIDLAIRIGINQGRAIVGAFGGQLRSDYTAIGPAVNLASRIEAKAHPHEILISTSVSELLPATYLQDRGLHAIKGYDQEIQLFAWAQAPYSEAI